jgi:hypothetical protein
MHGCSIDQAASHAGASERKGCSNPFSAACAAAQAGRFSAGMSPDAIRGMSSQNVGKKRQVGNDTEIPAELAKREAQDRARSRTGSGRAESPIDSMHVDAPKRQDNKRGHRQKRQP